MKREDVLVAEDEQFVGDARTPSKHVQALNIVTLHHGGLDVFFSVYELSVDSSNPKWVSRWV